MASEEAVDRSRKAEVLRPDDEDIHAPASLKYIFLGFFVAAEIILILMELVYLLVGYITGAQFAVHILVVTPIAAVTFFAAYMLVRRAVISTMRTGERLESEKAISSGIINSLPDAFFVLDIEGKIARWNSAVAEVTGYGEDELQGMKATEFMAPEYRQKTADVIQEIIEQGTGKSLEAHVLNADGVTIPYEFYGSVIRDAEGNVMGICGIGRDITSRKSLEDELRRHQEGLEKIVDERTEEARLLSMAVGQSSEGICITDLEGYVTFVNGAWAQMHRLDPVEVQGKHVRIFHSPEQYSAEVLPFWRQILKAGTHQSEIGHMRNDGAIFPSLMSASQFWDKDGNPVGIVAVARDITELKRSAEQLRESHERLSGIIDSVPDHMSMIDEDHNIVWANEVARRLFGGDLVGKKCYSAYHQREERCDPCVALRTFADGKGHEHETQVVDESGRSRYFWCSTGVAAHYPDGRPRLVVELSRDITERKVAENVLQKANLELDHYAHEVSHDLKGPLSVIMAANITLQELLVEQRGTEKGSDINESMGLIDSNVRKSMMMIEELLALAETGLLPTEVQKVNVRELMGDVVKENEHDIVDRDVLLRIDDYLGEMVANPTQIFQLFNNLVKNAINHNTSARPRVEVSFLGEDDLKGKMYRVSDNGPGIPEEWMDKIFNPFFRGGRGSYGIGLATVRKILDIYSGDVRVYNDDGACFEFWLQDLDY